MEKERNLEKGNLEVQVSGKSGKTVNPEKMEIMVKEVKDNQASLMKIVLVNYMKYINNNKN